MAGTAQVECLPSGKAINVRSQGEHHGCIRKNVPWIGTNGICYEHAKAKAMERLDHVRKAGVKDRQCVPHCPRSATGQTVSVA